MPEYKVDVPYKIGQRVWYIGEGGQEKVTTGKCLACDGDGIIIGKDNKRYTCPAIRCLYGNIKEWKSRLFVRDSRISLIKVSFTQKESSVRFVLDNMASYGLDAIFSNEQEAEIEVLNR